MKLFLKASHIISGHDLGMYMILDSIVLRGQTECVKPHGIQHIITLHTTFAGYDVQSRIRSGMSHV